MAGSIFGQDTTRGIADRAGVALQNNITVNSPAIKMLVEGALKDVEPSKIADFIEESARDPLRAKLAGLDKIPSGESLLSAERMHDFTLAKLRVMAMDMGLTPENTVKFAEAVVSSGKTAITSLRPEDKAYLQSREECAVVSPNCPAPAQDQRQR